jgi:hypothetical protein
MKHHVALAGLAVLAAGALADSAAAADMTPRYQQPYAFFRFR